MKQYAQIKARYPGALLLFRVGDFYETFGEDAVQCSKVLGITLTKRANGAASGNSPGGFPPSFPGSVPASSGAIRPAGGGL
ncbi:MAG: hypothetical protein RLZZ121_1193 [Bacteroidota bacterium]